MKSKPKFETIAIKSTENTFTNAEPVSTPIYLSSTYKRNSDGSYSDDLIYSRNDNPNRNIVETSIAQLENGQHCFAFSSGMAAISAIFQSLKTGDHIILPNDIYYTIKKLFKEVLSSWNLTFDLVDMCDLKALKKAMQLLPERQRTAIILYRYEGLSYREIGRVMKITEKAVKSLIKRGRENLKNTLFGRI